MPNKKLTIRFIHCVEKDIYRIQRPTWYGRWKYIGYWQDGDAGSVWYRHCDKSKQDLLDRVLAANYSTISTLVTITEYPTILTY